MVGSDGTRRWEERVKMGCCCCCCCFYYYYHHHHHHHYYYYYYYYSLRVISLFSFKYSHILFYRQS